MSKPALLQLAVLLLLLLYSLQTVSARFACPERMRGCDCITLDKDDYRLYCKTDTRRRVWTHDVAIVPGSFVGIRCGDPHVDDWSQFLDGDSVKVGFIETLTLSECRPIGPDDFKIIVSRLGIPSNLIDVKYESLRGDGLKPEDLDFFTDVKYLDLGENRLGDVDVDLLRGMSNLQYLGLRRTGVKPPVGFFKGSGNLKVVDLSFNSIDRLEPGAFDGLRHVNFITLWKNEIRELDPGVFRRLGSLSKLDLNHNKLRSLSPEVFADLKNLRLLYLSQNNVSSLPEGLFRRNPLLHTFKMSFNEQKLAHLPNALLADLPELNDVQMRRVGFKDIPENLIWNSTHLLELDLSLNFLSELPRHLLRDAVMLSKLQISSNDLTGIPEGFFQRTKNLTVLDLSNNQFVSITETTFEGLKSLEELNMNDNHLSFIHPEAFQDFENLKIARFANNMLTMYTDFVDIYGRVSPLRYSSDLQELYLANNNVSELFSDWIVTSTQLRKLDLYNNSIAELRSEDLQFVSDELVVNLGKNKITTIDLWRLELVAAEQESVAEDAKKPRKVRVLLQDNPIECGCDVYSLLRYLDNEMDPKARAFVQLDLKDQYCSDSNVMLKQLRAREFTCKQKKAWLVSNDPCGPAGPCDCSFRPADNVMFMNCANSGIKRAPEWLDVRGVYSISLDLRGNDLAEAPDMGAWGYEKVFDLVLSDNHISEVNESLITPRLEFLALDGNNLTRLDQAFLDRAASNESSLREVRLHCNPWHCDCEATPLLGFVQSHAKKMPELLNVTCASGLNYNYNSNKNVTRCHKIALADLSRADLCPYFASASHRLILGLSIGFGLVCLLFGLLVVLYFRYRTPINIWLYAHNACLCFVTEAELDEDKTYDAFVSYSHKDEHFVNNELVARLEAEPCPYRICIHERDWLAGAWIPTLIQHSVEESRRTIIVLSRNFINSMWSKVEFQTAHKRCLQEHRMRLIVVLLDDIQVSEVEQIDPELASYLKMNVYIKWGDPWFWQKLDYAMPHRDKSTRRAIVREHRKLERIQSAKQATSVDLK